MEGAKVGSRGSSDLRTSNERGKSAAEKTSVALVQNFFFEHNPNFEFSKFKNWDVFGGLGGGRCKGYRAGVLTDNMKEIGSRDCWQAVLNVPGALGGCGAFVSSLGAVTVLAGQRAKSVWGKIGKTFWGT